MKIKRYKIQIVLGFETLQPASITNNELKEMIKEGIKDAVPRGCKIEDVKVLEQKMSEQELKDLVKNIASKPHIIPGPDVVQKTKEEPPTET